LIALQRDSSRCRRRPSQWAGGAPGEGRKSSHRISAPPEFTMTKTLIQRGISLVLAAAVTLAMLGGIDHLAQPDEQQPQWAQQTAHRA
jgi:hypothetical protein